MFYTKNKSEKGIVKLILFIIGVLVILTLMGVRLENVGDSFNSLWKSTVLPIVDKIAALLK
jgi:hypothetical protein